MKIAVVCANGKAGKLITEEALRCGEPVCKSGTYGLCCRRTGFSGYVQTACGYHGKRAFRTSAEG